MNGRASNGRCVLVVDDDETFMEMLAWWLEQRGYRVRACAGANEARAAAGPELSAIVCDIELGEGTHGTALVAELRRHLGSSIPAVFVSGYRAEFVPVDTTTGIDYFLQKPFDLAELSAVLDTVT